ncbi:MAG TPA: hypothetical protein ENN51_00890, partial [candidate division WOR-3 bacterium]|nr:hypothetical protein [candidate division WOR-3 bacterium]
MMRLLISCLLAAAALAPGAPALEDTILVRDWLLAGPFPIGPREGITGLIEDPERFRPVPGETLRTALVAGGWTTWRETTADSAGWLETEYPDVDWPAHRDYYGIAGLMNAGYAWAEVSVPRCSRALAVTARCGFSINGRSYQANSYGDDWLVVPVLLDSGPNRILVSVSGFGDRRVRFLLVPPTAPVQVVAGDLTAPDLVTGTNESGPVLLGIPLLNTTTDYADSVHLRLWARAAETESFAVVADTILGRLPPLGVKNLPLAVRLPGTTGPVELALETELDGSAHADTVLIPVREENEARRETFRSALDNSCQYYAVLYPENYDPTRRYPVIFTLHGAGVEARGQASSYRPKDWAFVVAPTNRRPYGFDWQDWGRLDAVEVLDTILGRLP